MKAILFREIKSFFGSPVGYLVIAIFLIINGLFLWVFEGEFNILNSGYADLNPFFTLAPWVLLFLIPAVTMRSFSDEKKQGTLELLFTKPISMWEIVHGKFLGAFLLIVIAVLPTLIYVTIISKLGMPEGNLDVGSTLGSYFGLLFLMGAYTSIGIFCSTLSENQIVAFIISLFLCFLFYFGFEGISAMFKDFSDLISPWGMQFHFNSMSRGVIDTRDIIYFFSVSWLFLAATVLKLKQLRF
jgi:ABC-2 type transport system permease protein